MHRLVPVKVPSSDAREVMDSKTTSSKEFGIVVYLDDVLVTGKTEDQHLTALNEVLQRMKEAGL